MDAGAAGKTFPPYEFHVERGKIREFADAIGDPNPIYRDPDYAAEFRRAVELSPLRDRVRIHGAQTPPAVLAAYDRCDLFALPSRHENFGVAAVEALAAGVPVLASPHVPLAATISAADAGWTAETDRASLAAALHEAMKNRAELEIKGARARILAGRTTRHA